MAVAKLKPPPSDSLRVQLQEAIEAAAEAREAVDRHRNAITKTRTAKWAAQKAHEVAVAGVDKAIAEHAGNLAAAAGGADEDDAVQSSALIRMARLAVVDAVDEVEALRAAYDRLRQDLPLWEDEARLADAETVRCANEILRAPIQELLERGRQAWSVLQPLVWMLEQAAVVTPTREYAAIAAAEAGARPLAEVRAEIGQFLHACTHRGADTGPNPFAAARERLLQDPHCDISDLLVLPASPPAPSAA